MSGSVSAEGVNHASTGVCQAGLTGEARHAWLSLSFILAASVALRLVGLDQPIVENYVGRQIPTAMVARNLERGSGFFHPSLDTAPFPNYFLVEPPVYQALVVSLRRFTGWPLESCGRIVAALATALGGWGLFGLVRRRDGLRAAFSAVAAFSLFPVTLRYGRAFQPDALMLGAMVAGVECWDRAERRNAWGWRIAGVLLLAVAFAAKVTASLVLVPICFSILRDRRLSRGMLAFASLVPALSWYLWANHLIEAGQGSRASAENRAIWMGLIGLMALFRLETLVSLGKFLLVRAFTPLGFPLGLWGLVWRGRSDERLAAERAHDRPARSPLSLWTLWGLSVLAVMALLAVKLHHEYYWLILAPVVAAGMGRAWVALTASNRFAAGVAACAFVVLCAWLSRTTWQTPREWTDLASAARSVRRMVPPESSLVAPEALLYQSDRRGCRLEFTARAAERAAAEWPDVGPERIGGPLDLIEFYRARGARFVADVGPRPGDTGREALHAAIRQRYKVLVDYPSVLIARLEPLERSGHGQ